MNISQRYIDSEDVIKESRHEPSKRPPTVERRIKTAGWTAAEWMIKWTAKPLSFMLQLLFTCLVAFSSVWVVTPPAWCLSSIHVFFFFFSVFFFALHKSMLICIGFGGCKPDCFEMVHILVHLQWLAVLHASRSMNCNSAKFGMCILNLESGIVSILENWDCFLVWIR